MARREAPRSWSCILTLCMVAPLHCATAGDRGPIHHDFQVSLGGFFTNVDTRIRLDGEAAATGTDVDWEHEFDFGDQERFRVDAYWRFAERHKLRAMYFESKSSNTKVLTREIDFGDVKFPLETQVDARLDILILELAYEYAFLRRENMELGGSFGIHGMRVEPGLRGRLSTPGSGDAVEVEETADVDGPLPVLGVHFLWDIGANLWFEGLAQVFALEIDEYDGGLADYKIGITWFPWRHVGIGVGYNSFIARLDVREDDFHGRLRLGYRGPLAYLSVGF